MRNLDFYKSLGEFVPYIGYFSETTNFVAVASTWDTGNKSLTFPAQYQYFSIDRLMFCVTIYDDAEEIDNKYADCGASLNVAGEEQIITNDNFLSGDKHDTLHFSWRNVNTIPVAVYENLIYTKAALLQWRIQGRLNASKDSGYIINYICIQGNYWK